MGGRHGSDSVSEELGVLIHTTSETTVGIGRSKSRHPGEDRIDIMFKGFSMDSTEGLHYGFSPRDEVFTLGQ